MTDDRDARKRSWIMTGWSSLCAVMLMALLFLSIFATRDAEKRVGERPYPVDRTGQRMLY